MNTVEKIRDSRKEKRNPCSKWSLRPEEAEATGQVRGCVNSRETQFNMFSRDGLIIGGICKATQRVCVLDS